MFFQGKNSNVQELILNYILFKAKSKSHINIRERKTSQNGK